MKRHFYIYLILILVLGMAVGIFSVFFCQNCLVKEQVEKQNLERFEEMKKQHLNNTVIAQKVTSLLSAQMQGKEGVDSTLLSNAVNATVHYNSLADSILYQTKLYLLEKDVDDIRQETNNVINKYNGLLSLWIGIITVVGGIIPWFVIFRLENRNDQWTTKMKQEIDADREKVTTEIIEYKKMRDRSKQEFENLKNELSVKTGKIIKKLQIDTDAIRNDIQTYRNQYMLETDKNKIINTVFGITASTNPSITKCHTNRKELTRLFLRDLTSNLQAFINDIKKINDENPGSNFSKEVLLVLFQTEFGIIKSQTIFNEIHHNRELAHLQERLKKAIYDIMHTSLLPTGIIKHLEDVLADLHAFQLKI